MHARLSGRAHLHEQSGRETPRLVGRTSERRSAARPRARTPLRWGVLRAREVSDHAREQRGRARYESRRKLHPERRTMSAGCLHRRTVRDGRRRRWLRGALRRHHRAPAASGCDGARRGDALLDRAHPGCACRGSSRAFLSRSSTSPQEGSSSGSCLLRMREPDGEIVPPNSFLPTAERYGLIGEIDNWVIGRASEIAAELGPVQLNLSARSTRRSGGRGHDRARLEGERRRSLLVGVRDHRDGTDRRRGSGDHLPRPRARARLQARARRLRQRLRRVHLPQASAGRPPEDRRGVRPGPRHRAPQAGT